MGNWQAKDNDNGQRQQQTAPKQHFHHGGNDGAMSEQTIRQPFTAEEQRSYTAVFRELDNEGTGVVVGEDARATFEKTGLPPVTLGEIWQLADPENLGYLTQFAFFVALRLIGHVQNGAKPDVSLREIAGPLARFQPQGQQQAQSPMQPQFTSLPPLSNHDISKFAQLFARNAPSGTISGDQARGIFLKAKLPTDVLSQIWALSDRENRGQLSRDEFVIAMFLIQGSIQGAIKQLPQQVPQTLWDQVKYFQSPSITGASNPAATFSPQSTGSRPPVSRVPSSFGNAANDWSISPQKKAQFDNIFEGLDKQFKGVLGPNEIAPFLMTSKLPQDTLATIWDLADIHNTGEFTKDEFAIAMFLIQKKVAGAELPEVVPDSLLPPSHPAFQQQQQQQYSAQQYSVPTGNAMPRIPSRDSKPTSSMNDLVDLNDAFSSPNQTASDSRNVSNSTVNYTPAGGAPRPFVPSSSFGQGLADKNKADSPSTPTVIPAAIPVPATIVTQPTAPAATQRAPVFQAPKQVASATGSGISSSAALAGAGIVGAAGLVGAGAGAIAGGLFSKSTNNDLLADSNPEISGQLSKATTDMANLSNQIGSLTSQTTQLHEKRTRAERELSRMTALKNDIESKLMKLRAAYEQEVNQTEQVESLLVTAKQECEQLRQEASVAEAQFNQAQTELQTLQAELEETQKTNASLKERLSSLNAEQIDLTSQLQSTQGEVKQSKGLVSINSEQLHVADLKSSAIKAEIAALLLAAKELDSTHESYTSKEAQLEAFKQQLDGRERSLGERHQQHEQFELDFQTKEQELQARHEQQQQNEQAIKEQEDRVQQLFENLQERQRQLTEAEEQLQDQQFEYAQRIQQFTEKQITDATSGFGSTAATSEAPVEVSKEAVSSHDGSNAAIAGATIVGGLTAAVLSSVAGSNTEDEKVDTEFSSPVGATTDQTQSVTSDHYDQYPTNLDIDRPDSTTSSVQNNAPLSVRGDGDDIEDNSLTEPIAEETALPEDVLSKDYNPSTMRAASGATGEDPSSGAGSFEIVEKLKSADETISEEAPVSELHDEADAVESSIPGAFESTSEATTVTPAVETPNDEFDDLTPALDEPKTVMPAVEEPDAYSSAIEEPVVKTKASADDEFPPIRELDIDESDSGDDEFHETSESFSPKALATNSAQSVPVAVANAPPHDDFDFDGLEEAQEDFDDDVDQGNLNDELEDTAFYGANASTDANVSPPPQENEEWEQIFAGFGNQTQGQVQGQQHIAQPVASHGTIAASPAVRAPPRIATTPRSLAIQELTGMGFTKEEALSALEKEKWNLEAATNYLLDNA